MVETDRPTRLPGDMLGLVAVARGALLGLGEQDELTRVLLALLTEVERFLESDQERAGRDGGGTDHQAGARERLLWDVREALRRGDEARRRLGPLLRRLTDGEAAGA